MATLEELQKETDKYKDTLVIDFFRIKLFRRIIEDPDDFYYEFVDYKGCVSLLSCVGSFIPLIDCLSKKQYNYLVNIWNLNNTIQIKEI